MNCQDLFNAQLTDEGLCCTFNVVHRDNMFRNPYVESLNTFKTSFSYEWKISDFQSELYLTILDVSSYLVMSKQQYFFLNRRDLNDLNLTFPLPSVDWTPEGGYPADAPPDGFPWKPKGI